MTTNPKRPLTHTPILQRPPHARTCARAALSLLLCLLLPLVMGACASQGAAHRSGTAAPRPTGADVAGGTEDPSLPGTAVPAVPVIPVERAHAEVNGIRIYYEVHGRHGGVPLVLLPGGGSIIETNYAALLPELATHRTVIAMDEQNHGRSGHRDRPERFVDSADDVAALLSQLGHAKADVMGFSNGATVALQVAIRHPHRVRKLVFASGLTRRSGAPDGFWDFMRKGTFEDLPQPLKDGFLAVNPNEDELRDMYEKDAERMRSFEDIPDAQVAGVTAEVLVLGGDRDVPTPDHLLALSRLLPRARLVILPTGHGQYLGHPADVGDDSVYPAVTAALLQDFLQQPPTTP